MLEELLENLREGLSSAATVHSWCPHHQPPLHDMQWLGSDPISEALGKLHPL